MNETILINKRSYTVVRVETPFADKSITRVTLATKSGDIKIAMFSDGNFDEWDNPPKPKTSYSRVNMRSSKYSKYGR